MRLIDADTLIKEISDPRYPYTYDAEYIFKHIINDAPTVECKICKHFEAWGDQEGWCWHFGTKTNDHNICNKVNFNG